MSSSLPKSESRTSLIGSSAHRHHNRNHSRSAGETEPADGARSYRSGGSRRGQKSQREHDEQASARIKPLHPHRPPQHATPNTSAEDRTDKFFNPELKARGGAVVEPANASAEKRHGAARHARIPRDEELHPIVKSVFGQVGSSARGTQAHVCISNPLNMQTQQRKKEARTQDVHALMQQFHPLFKPPNHRDVKKPLLNIHRSMWKK